jgi:ATP-dependent DNA helicase RecQ
MGPGVISKIPVPPASALDAALGRLGYAAFRPGQREAIETLLERGRLLLVAPTGGGKSLTYQLPATLLPGTTLVVSPLVALMADQVQALGARGVAATFLASTLDAAEMRRRMAQVAGGRFALVYVAPERLAFPGFRGLLGDLDCPLVAVDEAHCISEWGHDFRPEYLEIGGVLAELSGARVLACTATATPIVRDEILARLGLPGDTPQIVRGFARPNLALRASEIAGGRERDRLVDAALAEALGSPGRGRGTAIVYAPTRRQAEDEASRLAGRGWRTGVYHAGLDGRTRERAQSEFAEGRLDIITATNAFGMGIDRPDVRAVIHLGPPSSIEAYYQEVGRAGRDGEPALGLLLVSPRDLPLRRVLIERGGERQPPDPAVVEHKWGLFLELIRWVEGGSCRHDSILRYFGDEAETLAGCGRCDVCRAITEGAGELDAEAATLIVRKALSGVARVHGRFGLQTAVKLVHGDADPRLERAGLTRFQTFGNLKEHPESWLLALIRRCVTAGWVSFTGGDRPVVVLTDEGRAVMRGERPARFLLPPRAGRRATVPRTPVPADRAARSPRAGGPQEADAPGAGPAEAAGRAGDVDGMVRERGAWARDEAASALFEALRRHRLAVARAEGIAPFMVASDRTLREIASLAPRDLDELQLVHGIGRQKALRYGAGFLEVVTAGGGDPARRDPAP